MFKKLILTLALTILTVVGTLQSSIYSMEVVMPSYEVKIKKSPINQPKRTGKNVDPPKGEKVVTKLKKVSLVENNLVCHMIGKKVSKSNAEMYARLIVKYSKVYKVDPYTVLAMIEVESGYRPNLIGNHGDVGLMQVLPSTAREFGIIGNLKDPDINIKSGVKYLGYTTKRFGESLGIVAYNQGEGNVAKGTYKTTYLKKVNKTKETICR